MNQSDKAERVTLFGPYRLLPQATRRGDLRPTARNDRHAKPTAGCATLGPLASLASAGAMN